MEGPVRLGMIRVVETRSILEVGHARTRYRLHELCCLLSDIFFCDTVQFGGMRPDGVGILWKRFRAPSQWASGSNPFTSTHLMIRCD